MRNISRKALSIIMSLVLVAGLCPGLSYGDDGSQIAFDSSNTLAAGIITDVDVGYPDAASELTVQASNYFDRVNSFINDNRWKNGTTWGGNQKPKLSGWTSYGCCSYAADFAKFVFNSSSQRSNDKYSSNASQIRSGDVLHVTYTGKGGSDGHWFVVLKREGNKLWTAEGNWPGKVRIGWSYYWISGSTLVAASFSNWRITDAYHFQSEPNPTPVTKAPTIAPLDIPGGKAVEIKNNESGAAIRYTTDGKTNPTNSIGSIYSGKFYDDWEVMGVRAIAYKSGQLNSSVVGSTLRNAQTATPTLEKVDMSNGGTIVLDAAGNGETIYYTTDGTNPSFNVSNGQATGTKYTGSFTLTKNATVKAIAVRSGERVSGMLSKDVEVVPPAAPSAPSVLSGTTPVSKIAVDDAVTVRWDEDKSASSYIATLYDEKGETVETSTVKAAQAVFTPSKAGKYSVGVKAVNTIGASAESERSGFEAMNPCQVNFVDKITDEQGKTTTKVLDKQLVRYGYSAENPAVPVKRGYTFAGWDKNTPLTNITQDGYEIIATWQIKSYTVRFFKDDGKTLITSQSVQYGSAATPPTPPAAETGYVFSGWSVTEAAESDSERDCSKVDSDMSLKATYAWADQELPVVVSVTNAKRNERVYTVDVNVKNNPTTATTAILRVSLKTSAGKLVQSARETISLPAAGATTNHTVTLKYEDGGYIATKAEVEVVGFSGDNRTGGAYSKAVTADVVNEEDYELATSASAWTTTKPTASNDYVIESEVQYRYQDKQTTTSTNSSLEGWTREGDPVTTYGSWSSNQSTTSRPSASDTLQITGSSTRYNYYHWHSRYDGIMNQDSCWVNSSSVKHTVSTTSPLSGPKYVFADKGGKASQEYGPYGTCAWNPSKAYWWLESTTTTYTYQTRSKTVSYGYYKWGDWSDWSSEAASSSNTRNVEERTVYRTRAKLYNDLKGTEDTSGKSYSISGKFDSNLQVAGKEATIMVYNVTNSDPNEDQIQYIGQTTIGADNSYSFSFIPKKEPSAETGDFIVSLGVKGSTGLVNVDKIEAPGEKHTVIYLYKNAKGEDVKVSEQTVDDGESAVVPDPPSVEGSQFQHWSASTTMVTSDMTVNALYTTATFAVAWVDWVNGGVFLETKAYGDTLKAPIENPSANGYTFKGWDALLAGKTTVAGNTVVNAVYDPQKYSVIFANAAGGVFAKQEVAYGEAATLPTSAPTADGMEFVAWDTTSGTPWWNVTEDLIVKPLFAYQGTTSSPYSTVELAQGYVSAKGAKVFLETASEGAKIFYTTDGSDPVQVSGTVAAQSALSTQGSDEQTAPAAITAKLYDASQGITVTKPTKIRAIACMEGMNDSSVSEIDVDVTATSDIANAEAGIAEAPFFYGEAVKPGVMVWLGDELLTYGEDYVVEYSDNAKLGKGTALVKGVGSYTGTQTVTFEIVAPPEEGDDASGGTTAPTSLNNASITLSSTKYIYNGSAKTPGVTVKVGGVTVPASGYTVAYSNNVNAGTATVKVTGRGSYTGSKTATFTIGKASNTMTASAKAKVFKIKFSKLKKKNQIIKKAKAFNIANAKGGVSFTKKSGNYSIRVGQKGKITVYSGLKKGTYKVAALVSAAGDSNYNAVNRTVKLKIKVQ